jgi:hypothetical protein
VDPAHRKKFGRGFSSVCGWLQLEFPSSLDPKETGLALMKAIVRDFRFAFCWHGPHDMNRTSTLTMDPVLRTLFRGIPLFTPHEEQNQK